VSRDDFVDGRIDYFNFIFTITGLVRPAGYTLCLGASILTSVRWGEKRESAAYAQFTSLRSSQAEILSYPDRLPPEGSTAPLLS